MRTLSIVLLFNLLYACHKPISTKNLPQPVTNNAVALVKGGNETELYSFNGLLMGKTWTDITNVGYRFHKGEWTQITMPEAALPVLASTAVNIGTKIYVIGGYTVNSKGEEKSVPNIFEFDTIKQSWLTKTTMPVPVDDTVALVYVQRYIYLISGWHDVDNVSDVQVYDTQNDKWFKATPFPAPAVFGQAGGIVGDVVVVCDGVKVVPNERSRDFVASPVCVKGVINKSDPSKINWKIIEHHSQTAYYRMAATGDGVNSRIVFVGGSDNPYNYDGVGYDGVPSDASDLIFTYDIKSGEWNSYDGIIDKNMDHRALLTDGNWFYIIGGMDSQQNVISKVFTFKLP